MLDLTGVSVSYGEIAAVRDCHIRVPKGSLVAVVGPNGAGKSSLLNTIVGWQRPVAGSIQFDGREIAGASPEALTAIGISLVPQGRRIFATLTVAENLALGATVRRDRAEVDAELEALLVDFPACAEKYRSPAGELSGGEQQQVAIARALLSRPKLLMLDEPSFGLAPLMIEQVFKTLERLRAQGVTVLLVEQAAERAVRLADYSYLMRVGEIVAEGKGDRVLDGDLAEMYLGSGGR